MYLTARERMLGRLRAYFSRERMPRLMMCGVLALTAGAAFFGSRALSRWGMESATTRYPLAVLGAWIVFIVLVQIWVWLESTWMPTDLNVPPGHVFDSEDYRSAESSAGRTLENALDITGNVADADSDGAGCAVALVIAAVVGAFGGIFALVGGAHALIAEAFLDIVVAGSLARSLPIHDAQWWAYGVLRRTWLAAVSCAVIASALGYLLGK